MYTFINQTKLYGRVTLFTVKRGWFNRVIVKLNQPYFQRAYQDQRELLSRELAYAIISEDSLGPERRVVNLAADKESTDG